jgi:hypothetical protein
MIEAGVPYGNGDGGFTYDELGAKVLITTSPLSVGMPLVL